MGKLTRDGTADCQSGLTGRPQWACCVRRIQQALQFHSSSPVQHQASCSTSSARLPAPSAAPCVLQGPKTVQLSKLMSSLM